MGRQPIKTARLIDPRHKGIKTIPSFVFPDDEARNQEFGVDTKAATDPQPSLKPMRWGSTVDVLRSLPPRNPGGVYSDGRRNYSSAEAARAANPQMQFATNPSKGTFIKGQRSGHLADPGAEAGRIATAMGYSKNAHDLFGGLAEAAEPGGGDTLAKKSFAPLGFMLDAIGADARFEASRRRGEPIDVAVMRAGLPVASSGAGLALGTWGGGIVGGLAGSYGGEKIGDLLADGYGEKRRNWGR